MADGFRIIKHLLKHEFNKRLEILLETGEERGLVNLGEAAEIPKFLAKVKEKNGQGISRNGKIF